ncbi:uncharacterized protein LOC144125844 isoform X2 [Amblyomma americanum]
MPHVCAESLVEQSRPEGSSALQGDTNRSAFTPYKSSTVLTNLQRGNVPTQTQPVPLRRCIHQLSAQGEISPDQITPDRLDLRDEGGLTPLLWASSHGQLSTVRHLLTKGAQVGAQGLKGETALLLAAAQGHSHVVRYLLQHGANPNQADQRVVSVQHTFPGMASQRAHNQSSDSVLSACAPHRREQAVAHRPDLYLPGVCGCATHGAHMPQPAQRCASREIWHTAICLCTH